MNTETNEFEKFPKLTEYIHQYASFGKFESWSGFIAELNRSLSQQQPVSTPRWVKASEMEVIPRKKYYAKWVLNDDAISIRSTGWFQESDGTFFWNERGYVPVAKNERENLFILDESTPAQPIQDEEKWLMFFEKWTKVYHESPCTKIEDAVKEMQKEFTINLINKQSIPDEQDEWINVGHHVKPIFGTRIEIFSPVYEEDNPMRHRIIDEQFLSISKDATHWRYLSEPIIKKNQWQVEMKY